MRPTHPAFDFIGILPFGGKGSRLAPFRYPKELLPVTYEHVSSRPSGMCPRLVSEYAIDALVAADIHRCLIIIAPWKLQIMSYFGKGVDFGLDIAYLYQEEACGLPYAIDLAYPWTQEQHIVLLMPDTIVHPRSCLKQLCDFYSETETDLVLGVFPTDEAQRLGPVVMDGNAVVGVYDKRENPPIQNTWGIGIWGSRFSDLLHSSLPDIMEGREEPIMGGYFNLAVSNGLKVRAMFFKDGIFTDVGTPEGIRMCMQTYKQKDLPR